MDMYCSTSSSSPTAVSARTSTLEQSIERTSSATAPPDVRVVRIIPGAKDRAAVAEVALATSPSVRFKTKNTITIPSDTSEIEKGNLEPTKNQGNAVSTLLENGDAPSVKSGTSGPSGWRVLYPTGAKREAEIDTELMFKDKRQKNTPKARLQQTIEKNDLYCEEIYTEYLIEHQDLQVIERSCDSRSIEAIKALMFNQLQKTVSELPYNEELVVDNYCNCLGVFPCEQHYENCPKDAYEFSLFLQLAKKIASTNDLTLYGFCDKVFTVLDKEGGKKNTLIFIGESDSGKTTFVNCLLKHINRCDVGNFSPPTNRNTSTFWLSDCTNKRIYRCEEMELQAGEGMEKMKTLMEGNAMLKTDIKYKQQQFVPARPTLVTMNGSGPHDVWKFVSSEEDAIRNRCHIFAMLEPLHWTISKGEMGDLTNMGTPAIRALYAWYQHHKDVIDQKSTKEKATRMQAAAARAEEILSAADMNVTMATGISLF